MKCAVVAFVTRDQSRCADQVCNQSDAKTAEYLDECYAIYTSLTSLMHARMAPLSRTMARTSPLSALQTLQSAPPQRHTTNPCRSGHDCARMSSLTRTLRFCAFQPILVPWAPASRQVVIESDEIGIVVENVLENTVVHGLKPNSAGLAAGLPIGSILLSIQDRPTHGPASP
jgi:hypothetical protein